MKKKWLILAVTMAMTVAQANTAMASIWIKDKTGWWYQHNNGSYTKGNWEKIRDRWYYFNSKGYLTRLARDQRSLVLFKTRRSDGDRLAKY